jgi:Zn-dependent protease
MWPKIEVIYAPKRKGLSFSDVELRHLLIATAVLILAFTLSLWSFGQGARIDFAFAAAVLAVGTGFILHEMAHKFVAQRFKCWAEFRYNPFGLLITIASSMMGFLMAAPGAVFISGDVTRRENGMISAAGPLTNLAIGGLTLPFAIFIQLDFTGLILFVAYINLFLGIFNMLPVPPLDGSKILQWNILIYIGIFAGLIVLMIPTALLLFVGYIPF